MTSTLSHPKYISSALTVSSGNRPNFNTVLLSRSILIVACVKQSLQSVISFRFTAATHAGNDRSDASANEDGQLIDDG